MKVFYVVLDTMILSRMYSSSIRIEFGDGNIIWFWLRYGKLLVKVMWFGLAIIIVTIIGYPQYIDLD